MQNRQAAFQLLAGVEAGAAAGEFVLAQLAFEAQGAFDEVAQAPGLGAEKATHFGDEVMGWAKPATLFLYRVKLMPWMP